MKQNELSHSEIERMSARIVTLTQNDNNDYEVVTSDGSGNAPLATRHEDDEGNNLVEIVRFVKREKEIATTKRELAESECLRFKHLAQKFENELKDAQTKLRELSETAKVEYVLYLCVIVLHCFFRCMMKKLLSIKKCWQRYRL